MSGWEARPHGVACLMRATVGPRKVLGGAPRSVGVQGVDVGELDAVKAVRADHTAAGGRRGVEGGALVGVLAVAEGLDLTEAEGELIAEGVVAPKPAGDEGVVQGDVLKRLRCQCATLLRRQSAASQSLRHPPVVCGIGQDDDEGVVLGRSPQQRGATDVDVLQGVLQGHVGLGDGGLERVEVHRHEVDGLEAAEGELGGVVGHVPPGQDAGVDHGVEGLDPPVQHLREARQVRHLLDGEARLGEGPVGAAGAHELHAQAVQGAGQLRRAGLVV